MNKAIKIFTLPSCPYCLQAKEYMRARGWEFEEKNVDEDGDALREMLDLSRQSGVPVIAVDGQVIVGFNKQLLDQLLEP